jgi:hypothetical protein
MKSNHLAIGILIGIGLTLLVVYISGYYSPEALNTEALHKASVAQLTKNNIQYDLSSLFNSYEDVMSDYVQSPTSANKDKYEPVAQKLDKELDSASDEFGLYVRRQVNLFKAWQYQLENASPQDRMKIKRYFLTRNAGINNALTKSMQEFNNDLLQHLINDDYGMKKIPLTIQHKMETVYKQTQPLLPAAFEALKNRKSTTDCLPADNNLSNPKSLANTLNILQYSSRYCAFLVNSYSDGYCHELRNFPVLKEDQEAIGQELFACQLAQQRLEQERALAQQKYGMLSYDDYIKKFVLPLVPQALSELKNRIQNKNGNISAEACIIDNLPVVEFRDPEVDAHIFAYSQLGPTLCMSSYLND